MDEYSDVTAVLRATPAETQSLLVQIGESIGRDRWTIGDVSNQLIVTKNETDLKDSAGQPVSDQAVFTAVSIMSKREVSARTVEYYAANAAFYPQAMRDQYEPLPFSHFNFARTMGDVWQDVLNTAMEYVEEHGSIPSEAWLRNKFGQTSYDIGNANSSETPTTDEEDPTSTVRRIQGEVRRLGGVIGAFQIDRPQRDRIMSLADDLAGELESVILTVREKLSVDIE